MYPYSPLLTDQYQIIMAYGYWQLGMAEQEAVFHLSFRKLPQQSRYIITAGLEKVVEFIKHYQFSKEDIDFLKYSLQPEFGFPDEFLEYLKQLTITCDIDAMPEGTLIFANEPLLRVKGPLLQCQLLETSLLNFINFASLIATNASHICRAAHPDPVIEFGLRRAQGPDGGLTATRSAYVGGVKSTSNLLAGRLYGIPTQGTQAHSWIMAFPSELEAFKNFAEIMKERTVLLVDTYNTSEGVKHAIEIGTQLKKEGKSLAAIRLDSGDLLELSKQARLMLDNAGLQKTQIMVSGDLNEEIIQSLKARGAPINLWGVGTKLVTSYHQPALNTIYKLSALKNKEGQWEYKMKLSDTLEKATLPGILQVLRLYREDGAPIKDYIYDIYSDDLESLKVEEANGKSLLIPILRQGKLIDPLPQVSNIRALAKEQVINFQDSLQPYPVELSPQLRKKCSR